MSGSGGKVKPLYDVLIAGGGVTGSALANRLMTANVIGGDKKIGIIDAAMKVSPSLQSSNIPNPRAYALSPSSLRTLGSSVFDKLRCEEKLGVYGSMQVWESDGPGMLMFHSDDIQELAGNGNDFSGMDLSHMLGAVVEDQAIVRALHESLESEYSENIDFIRGAKVTQVKSPSSTSDHSDDDFVRVVYKEEGNSTENEISTRLLVAADGGNSFVRNALQIDTMSFDYKRKAIICTIRVDDVQGNASNTAFQRFFPNGPIALLPTYNDEYANIVWSTTHEEASRLMDHNETSTEKFVEELNASLQAGPCLSPPLLTKEMESSLPSFLLGAVRGLENIGQSLGSGLALVTSMNGTEAFRFPPIVKGIEGRRFAFDLKLQHARSYISSRVALVGDSAHTIHPMAGQGLNLGLADAEALTKFLKIAVNSGNDIGDINSLQMYDCERRKAVVGMMSGIHLLHESFSVQSPPLVYFRSIGMNFVNVASPIRKTLAHAAAGNAGASVENYVS